MTQGMRCASPVFASREVCLLWIFVRKRSAVSYLSEQKTALLIYGISCTMLYEYPTLLSAFSYT